MKLSLHALFVLLLIVNPEFVYPYETSEDPPVIYLFPGQGADCRLFKNIQFPYDTVHLEFPLPEKHINLQEFAYGFIPRIDTLHPYILIGVSMGGMICSELSDILSPEKVIIISSAKSRKELPGKYRFQKYIPINKILPAKSIQKGAVRLAPRVEPERLKDSIFSTMLKEKDPYYLKRTVNMIINWHKDSYQENIIHIHGDEDNTLPIKNVKYNYLIRGGTHVMIYIKGKEISDLINQILLE